MHGVCVLMVGSMIDVCALSSLRRFQKFNNERFCKYLSQQCLLSLRKLGKSAFYLSYLDFIQSSYAESRTKLAVVDNLSICLTRTYNHQPLKGRCEYLRSGDRRGRKSASPYTQECSMQSYYMFRKGHYIILQRFLGPLLQ